MNKFMKKTVFSTILIFSLMLTTVGVALGANPAKVIKTNWINFRGNNEHNAVVPYMIPKSAEEGALLWANKAGEGFDTGAVGSPILKDGYLYFNQGTHIRKMDAMDGRIVKSGKMVGNSNFSIIPPTYANGMIFVGLSNGRIQAFDAKTLKSKWVYKDKLGGQPNSPITYFNGRIYTGFWNSETKDANFVCVPIKDKNPKKSKEAQKAAWVHTSKGGYYWAGAYVSKDFLLVGTDDGEPGYNTPSSKLLCLNPKTGKVLSVADKLNCDIRSNVSYDKETDRYYFTTKGGSFYSVKVTDKGKIGDIKELNIGGMSTSTPSIYNGRAYIGVSGKAQFGKYGGHNITVIDLPKWEIAYYADCMGYPQTSGLVTTAYEKDDGYVYVYFFENMTPGKLRYLKDKQGQKEILMATEEIFNGDNGEEKYTCAPILFTPKGAQAQYAICSPIADEYGTIYFKNDSAHMMAFGSKIKDIEIKEKPDKVSYKAGEKFNPKGMKVIANLSNGKTKDITAYITYNKFPLEKGESDIFIYYDGQLYNDGGSIETLYTTLEIKVN